MPPQSPSGLPPITSSPDYFEGPPPARFFVYRDTEQIAILEYDPVAAAERMEDAVKSKDETIRKQQDRISQLESDVIEAIRREKDALAKHDNVIRSENFLATLNAELRVQVRTLGRKIRSYGHKHLD